MVPGTAPSPTVILRPKRILQTGKGQSTTRIPPMILLTGIPPKPRKPPVALSAIRPQVPAPVLFPVLPAASLLISLMQMALHLAVILPAYERPMRSLTPPLLYMDLQQRTIWPTVKSATESQGLLPLTAVSPLLAAPMILPAIPMHGPIQPIGREATTQRRIIDPATAMQEIRSMPAPSATITLEADPRLIRTQWVPVVSQQTLPMQTGLLMGVTLTGRVKGTGATTNVEIRIRQYPRAGA